MLKFRSEESKKAVPSASEIRLQPEHISVPAETKEQRRSVSNSSLPIFVVPFFVIVFAAMGVGFYFHHVRERDQRQLYNEYTLTNAWQAQAAKSYEQIKPYLAEFRKVDASKPQDWARIRSDQANFLKLAKPITDSPPVNVSDYDVVHEGQRLVGSYENNLHYAELPYLAKTDSNEQKELSGAIADDLSRSLRSTANLPIRERDKNWAAASAKAREIVAKMSDEDKAKYVATKLISWDSTDRFETALAKSVVLPPGLDLEYAKRLR
jgi:hypothetical protein